MADKMWDDPSLEDRQRWIRVRAHCDNARSNIGESDDKETIERERSAYAGARDKAIATAEEIEDAYFRNSALAIVVNLCCVADDWEQLYILLPKLDGKTLAKIAMKAWGSRG